MSSPTTRFTRTVRRQFGRLRSVRQWRDDGMATAEYAIATLAAVAFAGILLKILTSDTIRNALTGIITRALQ
jgi:hypothetical protein